LKGGKPVFTLYVHQKESKVVQMHVMSKGNIDWTKRPGDKKQRYLKGSTRHTSGASVRKKLGDLAARGGRIRRPKGSQRGEKKTG